MATELQHKEYEYSYPNRTLCSILEDMRQLHKTHNYSYLNGLIEEVQFYGNRMEAAIEDKRDLYRAKKALSDIKKEYREMVAKYNEKVDEINQKNS